MLAIERVCEEFREWFYLCVFEGGESRGGFGREVLGRGTRAGALPSEQRLCKTPGLGPESARRFEQHCGISEFQRPWWMADVEMQTRERGSRGFLSRGLAFTLWVAAAAGGAVRSPRAECFLYIYKPGVASTRADIVKNRLINDVSGRL